MGRAEGFKHTYRIGVMVVLASLLVSTLGGCRWFGYIGEPQEYVMWGSEFVLAWDPPTGFGAAEDVAGYSLVYRAYPGTTGSTWTEIGTTTKNTVTFRVGGSQLPTGLYEFGIRSFDVNGNYSDTHRSTDPQAHPATGWYLNWLGGTP